MPKGSGGHHKSSSSHHKSSSPHFRSSGFRSSGFPFRSSSHRNAGRGIGLAGRVFIQTVTPNPAITHTLVLIGGVAYSGHYAGVFNGLIRLTGATGPGITPGSTINIGPNAVIAFT